MLEEDIRFLQNIFISRGNNKECDSLTPEYSIHKIPGKQTLRVFSGYSTHLISCLSARILQFHLAPFLCPVMRCHHHKVSNPEFPTQSCPDHGAGTGEESLNIYYIKYFIHFLALWI